MVKLEVQELGHDRASRTTADSSMFSHAQTCGRRVDIGGAGGPMVTNRNVDNEGQFEQGFEERRLASGGLSSDWVRHLR